MHSLAKLFVDSLKQSVQDPMQGAMDQTNVVPNQGLTHDLFLCPPQLHLTATYLGVRQCGIHPKCKSWGDSNHAGDSQGLDIG